jgi:hypothetical protein
VFDDFQAYLALVNNLCYRSEQFDGKGLTPSPSRRLKLFRFGIGGNVGTE